MKFFSVPGLILFLNTILVSAQNPIIIDHRCSNLSDIPIEWIDKAKDSLHIGYGHTSHGSQITSGMNAIESYYTNGTYNWSNEGGENELHLFEGSGESEGYLDYDVGYEGWDDETREYLASFPSCNVIIWSWCGQVNDVDLTTHYFEPMEQLEADFPDVKFVYMTGHLEGLGPEGSLFEANQQIRDYCTTNNKILFDFADIEKYDPDTLVNYQDLYANDECDYDPDGTEPIFRTENWAINWLNNNPAHELTQISALSTSCSHSVSLNCTKKGIASWYLWARLAGWNNTSDPVPVTDITITGEGGANTISVNGGVLQLYAEVLPENATNPDVQWSVTNGTGQASISSDGLVTAIANGTVTATASATDGSGVSDDFEITISNQEVLVEEINVTSEGGATTIPAPGNTLQLFAEVLPENATNPDILWSVTNGTGEAGISTEGLLTGIATGTVTATASATDGSGISGDILITIANYVTLVTEINISSEDDLTTISEPDGILQLFAEVLPFDADNRDIEWTLVNSTGEATISSDGLVTAIANGIVTAIASATDGSGVSDDFEITISNQEVLVEEINVTSEGSLTVISEPGGTLQLFAEVLPSNADNRDIEWSVVNGTGEATISADGLVTAMANGTVTVTASATDGSGISGDFIITISNQEVMVEEITIFSENGITTIPASGGTLQLVAMVLPEEAENRAVDWSVANGTGQAQVNSEGLVTALAEGTVTVTATATDGSDVSGDFEITVTGDNPNSIQNPASGIIFWSIISHTLYFNNISSSIEQVRIYDLNGKLFILKDVVPETNSIRLDRLQKGLYLLQFIGQSGNIQNKLIFLP